MLLFSSRSAFFLCFMAKRCTFASRLREKLFFNSFVFRLACPAQ